MPWEENGPGEVHVARISDEVKEAAWVADRIVALHEAGDAWSDCAVLCRTTRLFLSLQQAFNEREIPAEILGLAGLLKMPEVVEVLAYARAVATRSRASRSAGSCSDRGIASASRTWRASPRSPRRRATPSARRTRTRARPRRSCSPRRWSTWTRSKGCPTRGGRASRSAARNWRRSASRRAARRRVPRRGRSGAPASSPSSTPTWTSVAAAARPAQPGGVPRRGARLLAGPGGAHAARVPRVRGRRREPRQAGMVARSSPRRRTRSRS